MDDSATTRTNLQYMIEQDSEMEVCGIAKDGREAVSMVELKNPDVVVMDVYMPHMDGYEATQAILRQTPVPIIICSAAWEPGEVAKTFQAIEVGAVTAIPKPPGIGHADYAKLAAEFTKTVKLMSEIKVVRRKSINKPALRTSPAHKTITSVTQPKIICIGASTGGPLVLQTILARLPANYPVPIVIVQHISSGFVDGMVAWLQNSVAPTVKIAIQGERVVPGVIYFPPDDTHIGIGNNRIYLDQKAPMEHHLRPAVAYMFRSVAINYDKKAVAILLTGMGSDGAAELKLMKDKGVVTIAQDEKSSAVHGMPGQAINMGGAVHIMNPEAIASFLLSLGKGY